MSNIEKRMSYHAKEVNDLFNKIRSSPDGLTQKEAKERLEAYGPNVIPDKGGTSPIFVFLKQFRSILIYILLGAAALAYAFDKHLDTYVILAIILLNAIMGFIQEYRAEKAIEALKNLVVLKARVLRDGQLIEVDASDLVPGDILHLEQGDKVPADARIITQKDLRVVEAPLTGESVPVGKNTDILDVDIPLGDRSNMVWMGTLVAGGKSTAMVVETGGTTAIGNIAQQLEGIERGKGHFQKKADTLAKVMGALAVFTSSAVFIVGYFIRGFEFTDIFLFTIASLVSGIPEGLPAILVVVLAMGAWRMAKRNAIIRSLPATETLAVVDMIVADKTGTLTQNTMMVERAWTGNDNFTITGDSWSTEGEFIKDGETITALKDPGLARLLEIASLTNNASVRVTDEDDYEIMGDPTEAALEVLGDKAQIDREQWTKIDGIPFDQDHKHVVQLLEHNDTGKRYIFVAGAPETVLGNSSKLHGKRSRITKRQSEKCHEEIENMASDALRVIGLAYKEVPNNTQEAKHELAKSMTFAGIVGMKDPVRKGVAEAVEATKNAGIKVIMATGDHKATAVAVAKEIGLLAGDEEGKIAYSGQELDELSESEFNETIQNTSVFVRLSPQMKLRIATQLQQQGHVVAMTGDGVNDALALKKVDIGIAMGKVGTDVAREAGKIVLTDDNFASIVSAIEEGRIVFRNTRQASSFLVTTNFAEDSTILIAIASGFPLPLLPTQILWLNLVTDGVAGVPLAAEPNHHDVLNAPPRKKTENILSKDIIPFVLLMVGVMAILTMNVFWLFQYESVEKARTGAFAVMAFTQLFNALNMRSLYRSLWSIGLFSNKYIVVGFIISFTVKLLVLYVPFLRNLFQFELLSFVEITSIILASTSVLLLGEIYKAFQRRHHKIQ